MVAHEPERAPRVLTLDLGNTSAKGLVWPAGFRPALAEPEAHVQARWDEDAPARLAAFVAGERARGAFGLAVVASVAGEERTRAVLARLAELELPVAFDPGTGLVNRTRTPETVGVDRLYGAAGALTLLRASALVVDAGTALTVDAVRWLAGTADTGEGAEERCAGEFLGGAIAPGPALLARSLAREAARLPAVEPRPGASALGADTPDAIRAGVAVGFRGAARELCRTIAREAGLEAAAIVVTGGARAFLLEPDSFLGSDAIAMHVDPWLVHRGLLVAGTRALRASSS